MATKNEKNTIISSLKAQFETILSLDIERELVRKDDLGKVLNFEDLRETFLLVMDYVKKLDAINFKYCSLSQLEKLRDDFGQVHSYMVTMKDFDIKRMGNPGGERGSLITRFERAVDKFIDAAAPVLQASYLDSDDEDIKLQLLEIVHNVRNENERITKESQSKLNEINQILENAKSAAVKVGVASHGNIFESEALEHKTEAAKWLKYTVRMLFVTGGIATLMFSLMFCPAFQNSNINPYQMAISKIVILAICFIGVSLCNRNYRAHKHNQIVNKHRQNALNTFETFIKAASDDQTKNAVLLQTTQSIFSSHNTGYNSNENDIEMPNKIVEIIKSSGKPNS
jgi:hypothetical protein